METNVNLTGNSNSAQANSSGVGPNGNLFTSARDSYVGLNSKYGTVLGGYLSTPYRSAIAGLDVMPGSTGAMANHNLFGKANFAASAAASSNAYGVQGVSYTAAFRTTAIAYAMPTLYGFNGSIAYTGNGSNSATTCLNNSNSCNANQNVSGMSVGLGWDGYGIGIRGAFQQVKTNLGVPGTANPALVNGITSYLIGAQYTGVPGLKVAAAYGRTSAGMNGQTVGTVGTVGSAKGTQNSVWVGASYRFGNNEPALMYASNSNMSGLNQNNTAGAQVYGGQEGATQWGARWGYYLSKRTQVYGLVSQVKNNANGTYDFLGSAPVSSSPMYGGARVTTYGAGLRTNF